MNPDIETLQACLGELEATTGLSIHDVQGTLAKLRDPDSDEESCKEFEYELLAFSFSENNTDRDIGWGTYFGPVFVRQLDDGQVLENPSILAVDKFAIDYWKSRAQSTSNSLLKDRYAGLVWDLSQKAIEETPSHIFARQCCISILTLADSLLINPPVNGVQKLARALSLARSLNDDDLVAKCISSIRNYERNVAEDDKPGLWGFSFDLLVDDPKLDIEESLEGEIITDLEARLSRLGGGDPWACEKAADRLAEYYRKRGSDPDVRRVVLALGSAFEAGAQKASPMLASSWLQHMHSVYSRYGLMDEAEGIAVKLREIGPEILNEMQTASTEYEIPKEKLERYVAQVVDGTLEEAGTRIALEFLEKRDDAEKTIRESAKSAPLQYLISRDILDRQGRVVAIIGSVEDDLDGHIAAQIAQTMSFSGLFLSEVFDGLIAKFDLTAESLCSYLDISPAYSEEQTPLITRSIQAYLEEDYVVFVHLVVPQIENSLRRLIELAGGAVLKPRRGGGFNLSTLDAILRTPEFESIFGADCSLYLRVLLTDQRGWNIRNDVCHGLVPMRQFSRTVADRLLHTLFLLGQLRLAEPDSAANETDSSS